MPILHPNYENLNYEEMALKIGLKAKHMPLLVSSFVEESIEILKDLEDSIVKKDFFQIQSSAHSLKGSSSNLQLNDIYEMTNEMEIAAQNSHETFDYQSYYEAVKSGISTIRYTN